MAGLATHVAVREKEVTGEMVRLHNAVSEIEQAVVALSESLSSVLRVAAECGAIDKTPPEPEMCPLADSVRGLRKRLAETVINVQSLQSRIEV
jgi:hypothetical protein